MRKILVVLTIITTGCSFQAFEASPVTGGGGEMEEEYGPLSEDEIPECFSVIHKWNNGGFTEYSESLGEYCEKT